MQYKRFGTKYFVRIDKGEEIVESLKKFCEKERIGLGTVTGIGASDRLTVGLFDVKEKKYHSQEFRGNYEIAPVCGNITSMDGKVYLHLHINFCDDQQNSHGGHLNSAVVSATFEAVIDAVAGEVDRQFEQGVGLNLLEFSQSN